MGSISVFDTPVASSTPPKNKTTSEHNHNYSYEQFNAEFGVVSSFKSGDESSTSHFTKSTAHSTSSDDAAWGSNFWVTLVDPQTQTQFYACPATGQVDWNPPLNTFVLPPNPEGEWWELSDQSRGGLPYYYQTKTGETVWERPSGFIIPFGIIQESASGRRLSQTNFAGFGKYASPHTLSPSPSGGRATEHPPYRRSKSYCNDRESSIDTPPKRHIPGTKTPPKATNTKSNGSLTKRTSAQHNPPVHGSYLPPIPGSPYSTDKSAPPSVASLDSKGKREKRDSLSEAREKPARSKSNGSSGSTARSQAKGSYRPSPPQSLDAAMETIASRSEPELSIKSSPSSKSTSSKKSKQESTTSSVGRTNGAQMIGSVNGKRAPPSPKRIAPSASVNGKSAKPTPGPAVAGKKISAPVLNNEATLNMSPVKSRAAGKPILVNPTIKIHSDTESETGKTMASATYPMLPEALAHDIQQFSESDYAKQYFSTHRTGFIFRRTIPVAQMMSWQKMSLSSPLLAHNRTLAKDAVKMFRVIQFVMGDREKEKGPGYRLPPETSLVAHNNSTSSLSRAASDLLEAQRWLLNEGLRLAELRDEIYCQVMKQLSGNPNSESVFKGWQLLCVLLIAFPPSKNFESSLQLFFQKHTTKPEGRVDIMAKYCLRRLSQIAKKGPRGKPPTLPEIETAADAAFHPSTFGESLDMTIRLQERSYPNQKVPIVLPFLADGILALGGTKCEGIFRVPGDNDSVSELKTRIDKGYYTLEGFDDPHVLASLMKLWMRELCDPLVPNEMYNECITSCDSPSACVQIIERLPTYNRRVVLFVISFLQLFLDERVQQATKMTPVNLALVMAPNLLRCASDSMAIVFTNAQYEQIFVYNLLLHLKCSHVDPSYTPTHGKGAVQSSSNPRSRRI